MAERPIAPDCRSVKPGVQIPLLPPKTKYINKNINMKIKTWEKWYWGVDLTLIILSLIASKIKPEYFTIEINGVKRIMTFAEAVLGIFIAYVVIAGLIWLIVRYFVNKDEKK